VLPQILQPGDDRLWLLGANTRLGSGDYLLLASPDLSETQGWWRLIQLQKVTPDHGRNATEVTWNPLLGDGVVSGTLQVFALRSKARLFGYNAPAWSKQSYGVRRAYVPPGMHVEDFDEWPGMEIDRDALDLDTGYPSILPGSWLALSTRFSTSLLLVQDNSTVSRSDFMLSAQVSRITPAWPPREVKKNVLVRGRQLHTATLLANGLLLVVGGQDSSGAPIGTAQLFDPRTRTFSSAPIALRDAR